MKKKKDALIEIKSLILTINDVKELKSLLSMLKNETKENGLISFIKEERHFPFFRSKYSNTTTWYRIVGEIKAKAFELAQQKNTLTKDEDQDFRAIFDEQRGRVILGTTNYHRAYETLKKDTGITIQKKP